MVVDVNLDLVDKVQAAKRYFGSSPQYGKVVERAAQCLSYGKDKECEKELNKLPTKEELMEILVEQLKDKPVYKTLKKIAKGRIDNDYQELKGWFSLGTHIAIQLEHGQKEYGLLLGLIYEKIGNVIYQA